MPSVSPLHYRLSWRPLWFWEFHFVSIEIIKHHDGFQLTNGSKIREEKAKRGPWADRHLRTSLSVKVSSAFSMDVNYFLWTAPKTPAGSSRLQEAHEWSLMKAQAQHPKSDSHSKEDHEVLIHPGLAEGSLISEYFSSTGVSLFSWASPLIDSFPAVCLWLQGWSHCVILSQQEKKTSLLLAFSLFVFPSRIIESSLPNFVIHTRPSSPAHSVLNDKMKKK